MQVPLLDLTRDPELFAELRSAFESVLTSGRYIMGPEVEALEREVAEYVGAPHAVGVSSGSDALLLSFMALGIGPGDEVICPTYTFFATAGAIHRLGAKPVFVDIDPRDYNITAEHVRAAITEKTKAIVPVHLFGQCVDMDPLMELACANNLPVVEDAAQAIGSRYGERRAGSMGLMSCFSFFPSKNLGCLGDGGIVTLLDGELAEKARILRNHGMAPKYFHREVGGNFRLDALQAAFVRVRLRHLEKAHEARRRNAGIYRELFASVDGLVSQDPVQVPEGQLGLPVAVQGDGHIYNQFVVRIGGGVERRDAVRAGMQEAGVGCEVYYPVPLHEQECFRDLGYRRGDFPESERAAAETLALPIFPELEPAEIEHVASTLGKLVRC